MATTTPSNGKSQQLATIMIDSAYPRAGGAWLQTLCDAYVELGRLMVIATLLGVTSFIVTYVIKNRSLTRAAVTSEPLPVETARR